MSDEEKTKLAETAAKNMVDSMSFKDRVVSQLSFWDILWFILAIASAWKMGAGTEGT